MTQKQVKKLKINKKVVATLNRDEMNQVLGAYSYNWGGGMSSDCPHTRTVCSACTVRSQCVCW